MSIALNASRDNALAMAREHGWAVFPVAYKGKQPWSSNGQNDAATDEAKIRYAFSDKGLANVGIHCRPSGIYVIDVDMNPWKGKVGAQTLEALEAQYGPLPETYTVRSWSGGLHFYFAYTEGVLTNTTGTATQGLGPDIDTRGNGYVVAAPSFVSEDGHEGAYEVIKDIPLAPLPQWVIERLTKAVVAPREAVGPLAEGDEVEARVRTLAAELEQAPNGSGNATAARVAFMAGQYVGAGQIGEDQAIGILLDAVAGWEWATRKDETTMHNTIIRQVEAGQAKPYEWERSVKKDDTNVDLLAVDPEEIEKTSMWSTDNGQGVFLRDRIGDMRYAVGVGWMTWDGKRWEVVADLVIKQKVSSFYRKQFEQTLDKYKETMESKYDNIAKAYKAFMSSARLSAILEHLKVTPGVLCEATDLDSDSELLNVQNGIVNLRTGELLKHDRRYMMTKIANGNYRPTFTHKDWDDALKSLPDNERSYMQLRMGQAAVGEIPESDDAIFLIGHGGNGKSLWTSDGVFPALGDYAALSQASLISSKVETSGPSPERVGLRGVRFALIEELPEGRSLSVAEIKRITGTRIIKARNLHEKEVQFVASHTLFITANYLPPVAEVDEGSWRRLLAINFPYRFKTNPSGPLELQGDPGLKIRLSKGEQGQHDAIITWLVQGAQRYFGNKEAIMDDYRPAEIAGFTKNWRKEADRILAFTDDRLIFDGDAQVARSDLYNAFAEFLGETGHAKWAQETFLTRFRGHETVRHAGVAEGKTKSHSALSRPDAATVPFSKYPKLADQVRTFKGVRFRTAQDDLV